MNLRIERLEVALHDFTVTIDEDLSAEALGVFGPSGGGKTTLLEVIAGIRPATAGRVVLNGRDLSALAARERRIGYVPQDETLFPHMSVRRNLAYGAQRRSERGGNGLPRIEALADLLDIRPLLDRSVARLSGGERRRVAIARALVTSPDVLLLDEPLSGLDRTLKERTIALVREVHTELRLPVIFVSHERQEVSAVCDRVMVLDRGRVTAYGPPSQVL